MENFNNILMTSQNIELVKHSFNDEYLVDIKPVYKTFPDNYINDLRGWSFSKEIIEDNVGKLLTLDIDYGNYCSLNCPHCFRKNNFINEVDHNELSSDDLKKLILDAKKLGLRSIKFLGEGEPLENEGFLDFLEFLKSEGIWSIVFTKAHMIGDDELAKKYFADDGITTGEQLVKKLKTLNISLVVGFNAIDSVVQNRMVGDTTGTYVNKRNKALGLLVKHGFNQGNPTRLALGVNPVTKKNINEALAIYKWARLRNFYVVLTTTMISGNAKKWQGLTPDYEKIIQLYTDIYKFNIKTNLQTKEQLQQEGISSYAGGHPCNQTGCGMYVSLRGEVLLCPGSEAYDFGNVFENSLENIWHNSDNYKQRKGVFNCHCPAKDGMSLPSNLYSEVEKLL